MNLSLSAKDPGALQVNLNQTGTESCRFGRTHKHLKARRIKYKLTIEEILGQHWAIRPPGFFITSALRRWKPSLPALPWVSSVTHTHNCFLHLPAFCSVRLVQTHNTQAPLLRPSGTCGYSNGEPLSAMVSAVRLKEMRDQLQSLVLVDAFNLLFNTILLSNPALFTIKSSVCNTLFSLKLLLTFWDNFWCIYNYTYLLLSLLHFKLWHTF